MTVIYHELLGDPQRIFHTAALFGISFSMRLEPAVFTIAGQLSQDYTGGLWHFFALSNGGFYMAPQSERRFRVISENGFEGEVSADALGITACLYAYSQLSFTGDGAFQKTCADQFHLLRACALDHAEAGAIFAAID